MNGGYVMIDVKGLDFASTETQTRAGLYNEIKTASATDKTVVLVGAVNGDEDVSPTVVYVTQDGADYIVSASGLKITIESDDTTTVEASGGDSDLYAALDFHDTDIYGGGSLTGLYSAVSNAHTAGQIIKATNVIRDGAPYKISYAYPAGASYAEDTNVYLVILDKRMTIANDDTFSVN